MVPGRHDFSIPEAQRLSDLTGVDVDLEATVRICERCDRLNKELGAPPEGDPFLWWDDFQALGDLMFAAVVRYGRMFNSGVRKGIPQEWLSCLEGDLAENHVYFKALRDKYVAHSVSQLEDNQVFVLLSPQFSEQQEPSHVTVDRGRLLGISKEDIQRLKTLAGVLRKRVATEIDTESKRLLEIARGMPIEQIHARTTQSVPIPSTKAVFKARTKFSES